MSVDHKIGTHIRGHCCECGPNKKAIVRGHHREKQTDKDSLNWVIVEHFILECPACSEVFHQTDKIQTDDFEPVFNPRTGEQEYDYNHEIRHWPPPNSRRRPSWLEKLVGVDLDIYSLLNEVYTAAESGLHVLAAIGIRTAFDRGAELLSVEPSLSFGKKINELVAQGCIGKTERDALAVMVDAGSASAHRGWEPTPEQLDTMLQLIESFVHRNFILLKDITTLKNAVPARQKKGASPPPL